MKKHSGAVGNNQPEILLTKLSELLKKAAALQKEDAAKSLVLAEKAEGIALELQQDLGIAMAKKIIGNVYFLRRDYALALPSYLAALSSALKAKDAKLTGDIYYNLGTVYTSTRDFPLALQNLLEALNLRHTTNSRGDIISCLNTIGQVYWELQDYPEALKYFQEGTGLCDASVGVRQKSMIFNNLGNALVKTNCMSQALDAYAHSLKLKESLGDDAELAIANHNLGNLYYSTQEYSASLQYYLEAERIYMKLGDRVREAMVCVNLGAVQNSLNDSDTALGYYQRAIEVFKQIDMTENLAKTLSNMGNIYVNKAEYSQAIEYYKASLKLKNEAENPEGRAVTFMNLSESYCGLGDYSQALEAIRKAMTYSKALDSKPLLLKSYGQLGKIFAALGDFENAYEALNSYRMLEMEINRADKQKNLAEMMVRYDVEGKSKEIQELKSDRQAMEELLAKQASDKLRYLKLYRSKREEVKQRTMMQAKVEQLNSELQGKINQAVEDFRAQQQFISHKSKLESLGNLAAGIAHEIHQPLSAISMGIDNIGNKAKRNLATNAYLIKKCSTIQEDIHRIHNIIEQVRLFSRMQKDSLIEQVEVNSTVFSAIEIVEPVFNKLGVSIFTSLATEIPMLVIGNRYKLEQVLINLLSNAKDAILESQNQDPDTTNPKQISLSTRVQAENILIQVKDTGIGILPDAMHKIFDPFYTSKDPDKGTGLGLSISYGIIQEMGGEIGVDSIYKSHSIFTIELPRLRIGE